MTDTPEDPHQCWATPPDFWAAMTGTGPKNDPHFEFDIDVCASKENAKCSKYISRGIDALHPDTHWLGGTQTAWCNPGWRGSIKWMRKAFAETERVEGSIAVQMGIVNPSTKAWRYAMQGHAAEIWLLGGPRPQFIAPPGVNQSTNPRECALCLFYQHDWDLARVLTWNWTEDVFY